MSKILLVMLILLGAAEIVLTVMDIKMPIIIAVVLGAIFITLGFQALSGGGKKE